MKMLDDILAPIGGERSVLEAPAEWAQGRALFGGLSAAAMIRAAGSLVEAGRPLRALLADFVRPVAPGTAKVKAQLVRSGRSVTHVEVRIEQAGEVCTLGLAAFMTDRESKIQIPGRLRPAVKPPEQLVSMPYIEGVMPAFVQHYDLRWAMGSWPFSGVDTSDHTGWCRQRDAAERDAGPEEIAVLVDAWPAPVLQMLQTPAPSSTMTWKLELCPIDADERADDYWLYHSQADAVHGGTVHADAMLWAPSGRLAALSRQTYAIFG